MLHEARRMEGSDSFVVSNPRGDDLTTTGVPRHEMRLDQAGGDLEIGVHEQRVQRDWNIVRRGSPEMHLGRVIARIVVTHPHCFQHPRIADEFGQFLAEVWTMQTCGDEHTNCISRNSTRQQALDHRAQKQAVGNRSGDVTD